MLAKEIRIIHH